MEFVSKSFISAVLLGTLVITSSVFLAINYSNRHTPELDVYEWANTDYEIYPVLFDIDGYDASAEYGILPGNITDVHLNRYEDAWRLRSKAYHGTIETDIGPNDIQSYLTKMINQTQINSLFSTLRPTIQSLSEYDRKLEINPRIDDDWRSYEKFIADIAASNSTETKHVAGSGTTEEWVRPIHYIELLGNHNERILMMLYDFGITLAASTPHVELDGDKVTAFNEDYVEGIDYSENFGWSKSGNGAIVRAGDIYTFYFIEKNLEELQQLEFISTLYTFLSGFTQ